MHKGYFVRHGDGMNIHSQIIEKPKVYNEVSQLQSPPPLMGLHSGMVHKGDQNKDRFA